ncbi:GNAT family N-acetyltransferase [Falsirhodobacter halotolerans]|uniref:GNAT family N-acetyltransferase n=1 Tax=Falsirhodobacter halotolerans TaxID=1146892 RepID=UPI001FCFDD01|nr:GNAT family N-acetyltransferase [Falsirhodobacter halotolerans]MCJ8139818.1 GNAT family N-acetyltransferase [Falsirhodobacter halotolerans]
MQIAAITVLTVPHGSALCEAAFALRHEVFVLEQKVDPASEIDAYDPLATHFIAIAAGEVQGTLRLIETDAHIKIGRVAVRATARGTGIAQAMMRVAMEAARAEGHTRFYLSAQTDKVGFYEKFGFTAHGAEYLDEGIPHRDMHTY